MISSALIHPHPYDALFHPVLTAGNGDRLLGSSEANTAFPAPDDGDGGGGDHHQHIISAREARYTTANSI
jgi:hypothetical protein